MNNDLISREALKKVIEEKVTYIDGDSVYKIIDLIDNAPTVEERPQGEWIPVSDRLPEYSGLYLISIYDLVTVANFTGKYFCDRQMDKFVDVFAWQPLPEPYKKGGAV